MMSGILSGPGALFVGRFLAIDTASSHLISVISSSASASGYIGGWWIGKSVSTISFNRPGIVIPVIGLRPISFFVTNL